MSSDDAPVAASAPDPAEKPHHRGRWARIGIAVGSSVTYQIMWLSVAAAMGFVDVSWESTALALLGLLLLGHVLWAFVLRGLIRPPRRRDRLAAMLVCTPALVLAGWLVAWDRAIGPIPLGWIIATTVPAAFGYWASRPLPPAPSEEEPPPSPLPGFLRPPGGSRPAPPADPVSMAAGEDLPPRSWRHIGDRRIRVAVAAPITYALMGIVVITAISRTDGSDAETLGEVLLGVYAMVFRFVLLGILAWSTLMVVMIRPPRRTWRVAVFVGGTPISQLVAAVVIPHEAVGPWPARIVALLVPAALGYWAAAAAPPTTTGDERQQRHSTAVAG